MSPVGIAHLKVYRARQFFANLLVDKYGDKVFINGTFKNNLKVVLDNSIECYQSTKQLADELQSANERIGVLQAQLSICKDALQLVELLRKLL